MPMDHTWCLANPTKAAREIAKLREALQEQVDECRDPTCEMCIRLQAILGHS